MMYSEQLTSAQSVDMRDYWRHTSLTAESWRRTYTASATN